VGLSARPAQGSACHQFPFRGSTIPGRSVSRAGIAFFRIHRHQITKDEVEIHEGRRGLVLLRRSMASDVDGGEAFTLLTTDPSPDVAPIPSLTLYLRWQRSRHVLPLNATLRLNYHFRSILRSTRVNEDHDRHFQMRPYHDP
jgi:hypothetical protein